MAVPPTTVEIAESAERHLLTLGVQYYVSARSSALAQQMPVTGNLFHHAIEMFIKAGLVNAWLRGTVPADPLKKLKDSYGHGLMKLWEGLKSEYSGEDLSPFDDTVSTLDDFETLRYPESAIKAGAAMTLDWASGSSITGAFTVPSYGLVVNDIDKLVVKLFEVCCWNPRFFPQNAFAKKALHERNPFAQTW